MSYFESVDPKLDFPKVEKDLLDKWYREGIVDKYLNKNNKSSKNFSFLDGPITANNPMAVHHAWGRTYKDLWQRYKNMQGFKQRFQNGFDCQGLWVEVEVEKELGLKNKRDIENLVPGDKKASIAKFVDLCKERVDKYSKIQTEQSKRLGYFMDWDNSYYTMSDENNYAIWNFLKKCNEMNLIYKGHDVVPWCPRCQTAISQHEMLTEDYKEITHDSVFIKYPLDGKKNTYLLAWTTTPWTLPGNIAIAVDPKKDYVEIEDSIQGSTYIVIKEAAERLKLKIKKTFKGGELVGLNYSSPFDNLPRVKKTLGDYKHRIIATDPLILPVSLDEGTGLIHIACGQGSEDYQLGKKEKLPVIEIINDEAYYLEGLNEFTGQSAKKHPEIIIEFLKAKDSLFDTQKYTHRYPACWRCKTELVWKVTDEWYISMDKGTPSLRERMVAVTKKIHWLPEFGLERELDWLKNMHDWLISKKNRYWGLALPIWECAKCKNFDVIGSFEELKEKAFEGFNRLDGHTPHKPWIDEVKIKCSKCGETVSRIFDVGNPWLDAGIVPYSTIEEKDRKNWLPADFITESFPGQFKNWFYSLIAMSTVLENKESFKTVLGFGTLVGEDGRPMHKSWGNSIEFNEGADKIGADVMRWMYARANPAENMLFGYKLADEVRRRFHLKLWNIYNFFVTYANLDNWKPDKNNKTESKNVLDKWIIVRFNQTNNLVTKSLDEFDAFTASDAIDKFVDDLSLWYIRRSRDRVGPASESEEDKNGFYNTTYQVLTKLSKILSPFTPFLADIVYVNLTKEKSVHLSDWPNVDTISDKDLELVISMAELRTIVEQVHAQRKLLKIPVRQPLSKVEIFGKEKSEFEEEVLQIAKEELNIKQIFFQKGNEKIVLDTKLTPKLEEESKVREFVRNIQEERKKMGLNLTQKVKVENEWLPESENFKKWIMQKAQVESISKGKFNVQKI